MTRPSTRLFWKAVLDRTILSSAFIFLFFVFVSPQFTYVQHNVEYQGFAQPAYANLLSDNQGGNGIAFEQLLGDAATPTVSYKVKKWDTVDSVAAEFWTTERALQRANAFAPTYILQEGQTIKITYDEGIVYAVEKPQTLEVFAAEYKLNLEDVMNLNYITDATSVLEVGQELFLDLNAVEAESKWLIKKKEYKEIYVPMEEISDDKYADSYVAAVVDGDTQNTDEPVVVATEPEEQEVQQEVIFQKAEWQQVISADQMKRDAEEKKKEAEKKKTQPIAEQPKTEQVKVAAPIQEKPVVPKTETKVTTPTQEEVSCPDNSCPYQGKCVKKPEQAFCVANTPAHAWTCKEWYREEGNTCIDEATRQKQQKEKKAAEQKGGVVKSAYVNPKNEGFPWQWFAWWNCTYYAAYVRRKAGHPVAWRGNGWAWLGNAAAAGYATGKKPAIGALAVFKNGRGWYGHVAVVTAIDGDSVRIDEMNYKGRGIYSQRWVTSGVSGYIYPPK